MDTPLSLEKIYNQLQHLPNWNFNIEKNCIEMRKEFSSKEDLVKYIEKIIGIIGNYGTLVIRSNSLNIILGDNGVTKKHIFIAEEINKVFEQEEK